MHEARRRATAAAERRKQLTAGSGQRLGGASVLRGTDIRRVIADAAQRRIDITKGCASNTEAGNRIAHDVENNYSGFRTKAEEDDANERAIMQAYIELLQEEEKEKYGDSYVPPSQENPAGMRSPPPIPTSSKPPPRSSTPQKRPSESVDLINSFPAAPAPPELEEPSLDTWTCPVCTLVNPLQYLACDACLSERPSDVTPPSPPTSSSRRPTPTNSAAGTPNPRETPNALKPRLKATDALNRFEAIEREKQTSKPVGWLCTNCGNFMEQQWWTCANCGMMKASS